MTKETKDYKKENEELKDIIKALKTNILNLRKAIVQLELQNIAHEEQELK